MNRKTSLACVTLVLTSTACFSILPSTFNTHKNDPRATPVPHPPGRVVRSAPVPGFARGVNVGNALDAPKEGEWGVFLRSKHFSLIAEAGFDHVRLPIRFSAHAGLDAPYTIQPEFFERIDWAIEQAISRHLGLIIDVHYYDELMKDPDGHRARFLSLWRQIAERYQTRPRSVAFELLNEPKDKLEPDKLNPLMRDALRIVRQTNPDRVVIIDSYFWASADWLYAVELPASDKNVVGSFHCYAPFLFTHQASPWMDPEYQTGGVVFPGPPDKPIIPVPAAESKDWVRDWFKAYNAKTAPGDLPNSVKAVLKVFDEAGDFVQRTGKPVYLGEFATIDRADLASRERYTRFVREEAERRGIGWAYWDDGGLTKIMAPIEGQYIEPLREALLK